MFEERLHNVGLSEKEASTYIALLQVDSSPVLDIARRTNINRTTVYVILESLMKKGLVTETRIGKKTQYQAEPPERLETYIQRQKILLEEQSKRAHELVSQLKSIKREPGERPMVKYFEGKDGIISSNEELFEGEDSEKVVYFVYPKDKLEELFSEDIRKKYRDIRLKKNIQSKSIYTSEDSDYPSDKTGTRIKIDGTKYPITCDIAVLNDKVKISILGDTLSGIFIRSKDFADTLKSLLAYIHDTVHKK